MNLALAIMRWGLFIIILLAIFGLVQPYIAHVGSYEYLHPVIVWESFIDSAVKTHIPTVIGGYHLSHLFVIIGALILINWMKSFSDTLQFSSQRHKMINDLKLMQKTSQSSEQTDKIAIFESKLKQSSLSPGQARQNLLKEFSSIKKELEKMSRDLVFLSIDIVDSAGMKHNEDQSAIELDFIEYRNYIEAKFKKHGLIKDTWTPDGVMACFNTLDAAIGAAQDILSGLTYFNSNVKTMKKDFLIRCGINGGRVYYDESMPLEKFSDRVIDIAGHMQKHCPPNSILVARQLIEPAKSHDNFVSTKRIVDGMEVCEWVNKTSTDA